MTMDVLVIDEAGQMSAQQLGALDTHFLHNKGFQAAIWRGFGSLRHRPLPIRRHQWPALPHVLIHLHVVRSCVADAVCSVAP